MKTKLYANFPKMALNKPADWVARPILASLHDFHRQLLLISGRANWTIQEASNIIAALPRAARSCWIGNNAPTAVRVVRNYQHYRDVLGEEFDVAIIDASAHFRLSVLAAVAGTVRGNGTVILLCPELPDWPTAPAITAPHFLSFGASIYRSRYIPFLIDTLLASSATGLLTENESRLPVATEVAAKGTPIGNKDFCLTNEQKVIFNEITQQDIYSIHCSCIVAKRGRGKSTVVGAIASHFLSQGMSVCLTSPSRRSVMTVEHYANISEPKSNGLSWIALDNPKLLQQSYDVLIADEAAAIPLPVLRSLIKNSRFTLLSTTIDGYEGSGQGFRTKFIEPENITVRTLSEPIRWASDDPVEAVISRLTYSSSVSDINPILGIAPDDFTYQCLSASEMNNDQLLQLMALLSAAHYQSSPDDLVRLTDSPDTTFHLLRLKNVIVAAAAVEAEGGNCLSSIADEISSGKRRVKGHLTAQSLALMSACATIAVLNIRRINRIAVLPAFQGHALGSHLLAQLKGYFRTHEQIDLLTSSFGADKRLLNFWQSNGFITVKWGRKPDKASGLTSALVALPLSANAEASTRQILDMESHDGANDSFIASHLRRLRQFAEGYRGIDHLYSSSRWTIKQCPDDTVTTGLEMLDKGVAPSRVAAELGFEGKKTMLNAYRTRIANWLDTFELPD